MFLKLNKKGNHLVCGHLCFVGLHDEPEPVAGDSPDAEGGHDHREVLTSLYQLTQDARPVNNHSLFDF
jgi:hypothetical protein